VIRLGRVVAVAAVILVILPIFARAAAAQDTTGVRADSARAVAPQDSLAAPDSAAAREAPAPLVLPTPQPEVPVGPLPPYTRYVFTRDSILWSSAETLGELLAEIPGVYLTRSGFLGEPTYVQYGGRGGSALKVFWDGMEWEPLGNDTLFAEPSQIPLLNIRRVDVVVTPARLDVYLVSERHEQRATRSVVRIASGSFSSAAYTGMFQYHWNSGITLDLAANFHGTDGPNQARLRSRRGQRQRRAGDHGAQGCPHRLPAQLLCGIAGGRLGRAGGSRSRVQLVEPRLGSDPARGAGAAGMGRAALRPAQLVGRDPGPARGRAHDRLGGGPAWVGAAPWDRARGRRLLEAA
jgi:hypothetical protein